MSLESLSILLRGVGQMGYLLFREKHESKNY